MGESSDPVQKLPCIVYFPHMLSAVIIPPDVRENTRLDAPNPLATQADLVRPSTTPPIYRHALHPTFRSPCDPAPLNYPRKDCVTPTKGIQRGDGKLAEGSVCIGFHLRARQWGHGERT